MRRDALVETGQFPMATEWFPNIGALEAPGGVLRHEERRILIFASMKVAIDPKERSFRAFASLRETKP